MRAADRAFFSRPVLEVAPELLGALISVGGVTVRLTEVEAYAGTRDPGSHAFRGPTPRTAVMFGPAGHLYVYFSYGMHWCANLVCGPEGEAGAVLMRAGEVVHGEDRARERRDAGRARPLPVRDLARGPARLTASLGLTGALDGVDLLRTDGPVRVDVPRKPATGVATGPRVGVSGPGGDGTTYPWRFWLPGEPTVSPYRAAVARRRATTAWTRPGEP